MTRRVLCVCVLALMATAGLVAADSDAQRPFKSRMTVTQVGGDNPPDQAAVEYCAANGNRAAFSAHRTGRATHMGKVWSFEFGCLDFSGFPIVHIEVWSTMIAANGDELSAHSFAQLDLFQAPPVLTSEGSAEITGGTGRFANATGQTWGHMIPMYGDPGYILITKGWISY